eukprot:COSAG02_NODE_8116_length_2702_cov_2.379946_2_plen_100_part_00
MRLEGGEATRAARSILLRETTVKWFISYRAVELREVLRPILGPYYLFDPQPMYSAVWQVANECHHVEGIAGVQYYRHKEHRSEAFRAKEAAQKESAKTK